MIVFKLDCTEGLGTAIKATMTVKELCEFLNNHFDENERIVIKDDGHIYYALYEDAFRKE